MQLGTVVSRKGPWEQAREVSQVQMAIDSGLYIDYGLLSGLAAKSELRELLDEFYEDPA
jgi:hypothetical protein